jgi:hypothetical protein
MGAFEFGPGKGGIFKFVEGMQAERVQLVRVYLDHSVESETMASQRQVAVVTTALAQ